MVISQTMRVLFNQMIQFGFGLSSEVWRGLRVFSKVKQRHCTNRVIAAGLDAAHDNNVTILPLDSFLYQHQEAQ